MLHFWCWRWALYTKTEIAQIFYIPISSRLMLLHTHLSSPGRSCLCWTRTAKREPRSQTCGCSDGQPNPAAGSDLAACPEQVPVLSPPRVPPNQHLQTELLPFCSPHVPNAFLHCLLSIPICWRGWHNSSHPPPESSADACGTWDPSGVGLSHCSRLQSRGTDSKLFASAISGTCPSSLRPVL